MNRLTTKIIINTEIELLTGLRIGDSKETLDIGGVDSPVVRRKDNNQPYIPGSSIKGKIRCLLEQIRGLNADSNSRQNRSLVCALFGSSDNADKIRPLKNKADKLDKKTQKTEITKLENEIQSWEGNKSRIIVRDSNLSDDSIAKLEKSDFTDMPFTEIKWENVIDRVKGAAKNGGIRQIERVPAGASFKLGFIINIFEKDDKDTLLSLFIEGLELLEDDYLGGSGTRGYGQIAFKDFKVFEKAYSLDKEKDTLTIVESPEITAENLLSLKDAISKTETT
jgi:CRISPR-associated protein Csm3